MNKQMYSLGCSLLLSLGPGGTWRTDQTVAGSSSGPRIGAKFKLFRTFTVQTIQVRNRLNSALL